MFRALIIILLISLNSCGLLSESKKLVEYKTTNFESVKPPKEPDYQNLNSWAVHPEIQVSEFSDFENNKEKLPVDVFFIYPTMHSDKNDKSWNADIFDPKIRDYVLGSTIKYQSSAWYSVGDLYAPLYRQAHLRVFEDIYWENGGKQAFEIAYQDVKNAFIIFLEKYNSDKPIIIASHSQGAGHAKRILQDFFDGKPLQKKLIAAYLIGTKITDQDFKNLKLMTDKDETGGFVTWNTHRKMSKRKTQNTSFTVPFDYLDDALCINPITWNLEKTSKFSSHKGFLYLNSKVYPKSVKIENMDKAVYVDIPKMDLLKKIAVSTVRDYHKADINMFWEDIRLNSINRSKKYLFSEN